MSQAGVVVLINNSGQAILSILVDTGINPVTPDGAGQISILGEAVAAGTHPVRTDGATADSIEIQVQRTQAIASTDATKVGLAAFDSADFSVDANGFVTFNNTGLGVLSVSGTANRITSTGGQNPIIDIAATYVGQTSITTLGTVATGIWQATAIGPTFGGTGLTSYASGDVIYASATNVLSKLAKGSDTQVLTLASGIPTWATPTTGTVTSVSGTLNRITSTGGATPVIDISAAYVGQTSITTLGTVTTGTWNASTITETHGGTNQTTYATGDILYASAANTLSKLAAGSNTQVLTLAGGVPTWASPTTGTVTSVSGTLNRITSTGGSTPVIDISASYVGQSSITTLGTITTGVWNGTNIDLAHGGTNASLVASNGGIFYSTASAGAILAGTATARQMLQSGATAAPAWSTSTWPATTTVNRILYSSATSVVGEITTANNSILSTDGSGVPSLGTSLSNDYTFTSATAGATRTLTVSNTDNTNTASIALIKAVTGGASAGDALFQASTTTTTWSFGVDNSVTSPTVDPFVIAQGAALGTNNVMSIDTSGAVNLPLQPAFHYRLPSTVNNVTGDGTVFTIGTTTALTKVFDVASNCTTAGVFTAPVTGIYMLGVNATLTGGTIISTADLIVVTTGGSYRLIMPDSGNIATVCGGINTVLASMTAGDTASFTITSVDTGGKVDDLAGGSSPYLTYIFGNLEQ